MNIKGTFFTIAISTVIAGFGLDKWTKFMAKMADKDQ